jgi:hypothetical protein
MFAKILITVPVLMFTVLPPLVDFGESHVRHPDWTRHARFHTAWMVLENSMLGLLALALIWYQGTNTKLLIAGGISTLVLGGFMLATLLMPLYSGALSDPGPGKAPHESGGIDLNLAVFGVGFILSLAGLVLVYLDV